MTPNSTAAAPKTIRPYDAIFTHKRYQTSGVVGRSYAEGEQTGWRRFARTVPSAAASPEYTAVWLLR
jgi:hypothetical protein